MDHVKLMAELLPAPDLVANTYYWILCWCSELFSSKMCSFFRSAIAFWGLKAMASKKQF